MLACVRCCIPLAELCSLAGVYEKLGLNVGGIGPCPARFWRGRAEYFNAAHAHSFPRA